MNDLSSAQGQDYMDERTIKRNRLKLVGIFAVAVLPLIAAVIMYFGGVAVPNTKTNKGNLIWPPIHLESAELMPGLEKHLSVMDFVTENKKWVMMVTGGDKCAEECMAMLHTARQVNVSMAKEMDRVSRILVADTPPSKLYEIESKYPELVAFQTNPEFITNFYASAEEYGAQGLTTGALEWRLWIVDPLGNIILQYTSEHDGYDMIHDLKRVLKLSNIG